MRSGAWAGALSWCIIQVWFSHNSRPFLRTVSNARKLPGTTVYHLITWYKFMMGSAFPIKKHNQRHLDLWPTHRAFFGSRRPFPHPLRLHLGFNIIPINPRLISCYDVRKSFHYHSHWQAVPGLFQYGSVSDRQSNAARILHWRDAFTVFFQ